jgi:hypothetical protein
MCADFEPQARHYKLGHHQSFRPVPSAGRSLPKLPPSAHPQNQSDLWPVRASRWPDACLPAGRQAHHPPGDGPRLTRPPEVRIACPHAPTRGLTVISLRFIPGKSPLPPPNTHRTPADMPPIANYSELTSQSRTPDSQHAVH